MGCASSNLAVQGPTSNGATEGPPNNVARLPASRNPQPSPFSEISGTNVSKISTPLLMCLCTRKAMLATSLTHQT